VNPLAKPTTETTPTLLDCPPPDYLKHKPLFMLPYAPFDGPYVNDTDAMYLSVGLAQWRDEDETSELSAKVWRMPDQKWSRQSEEIPLHRLIDLCILLTKTFYQTHSTNAVSPVVEIPAGTFEYQKESMGLRRLTNLPAAFDGEYSRIKQRLKQLRDELADVDLD